MLIPKSFIPFGRKFPCKLSTLQNKLQHQNRLISCLSLAAEADASHSQPQRRWKEKKIFTPGPLMCSPGVKAALNYDLGSRDSQFIQVVQSVRQSLVQVAGTFSN
jgi:hypothetical protein